nr:hypothetical protein Iba_chr12cCG4150 [Ipomoea batatas]
MFSPRVLYQPKLPFRRFPVSHNRHSVVHLRRTLLAVHSAFIELKSHSRSVNGHRHWLIGHRLHELGLLESGDPLKSLEFGLDLGRLVFLAVAHFHGVWVIGFGGYAAVEEDVEESGADPAAVAAQAYDVAPKLPLVLHPISHRRHSVVHPRLTLLAVNSLFIELKRRPASVDGHGDGLVCHGLHKRRLIVAGDPLKALDFGRELGGLFALAEALLHGVWVVFFGGYAAVDEDVEESGADPAAVAAQAYEPPRVLQKPKLLRPHRPIPHGRHGVGRPRRAPHAEKSAFVELKRPAHGVDGHGDGLVRHGLHDRGLVVARDELEARDSCGGLGCLGLVAGPLSHGVGVIGSRGYASVSGYVLEGLVHPPAVAAVADGLAVYYLLLR